MIGLGMMSLGQLLKTDSGGDFPLAKRSFGEGLQIVSVLFMVLALASFLIATLNEFSGGKVPETTPDGPERPRPAQLPQAPPPPPPPPKKKYTERDFMPPAMRADLAARERKEIK